MELPVDLYNRLSEEDLQILSPDAPLQSESDKVVIDRNEQLLMESGFVTAQYLIKLS